MNALIVSCGMRGKRIIPGDKVRTISDSFILVDGVEKYTGQLGRSTGRMIHDTSGLLIGYATDFAIDETKMEILALEMAAGFLFKQNRNRLWVYQYTVSDCGELIIPASLHSELIDFREGSKLCAYPP